MLVDMRNENKWSKLYDFIMLIAIFIGIFPLMFRTTNTLFWIFDLVSGICYIIDYIMRWSTADYKLKLKPWAAFSDIPIYPDGHHRPALYTSRSQPSQSYIQVGTSIQTVQDHERLQGDTLF